ncbi:MAG: hypothetical protein PHZ26_01865 [Candidatus Gracilibacteria bacterium]|nr:hypothetical protein [Candidatus Gracilibacteria bacterium]MDD2908481.1 hypothetical protein [Candidatus Gracilibacteria bacterium]
MKKLTLQFLLFFLLSSCSYINDTSIKEKNIDVNNFLKNTESSTGTVIKNTKKNIQSHISTGLTSQEKSESGIIIPPNLTQTGSEQITTTATQNENTNNTNNIPSDLSTLEKININDENIINTNLTDTGAYSIDNTTEEDIKELIDILINSGN